MKQIVKKMGLTMFWSLAFIIGSMFLVNDLHAQNQNTLIIMNAPNGKSWVTAQQANVSVQDEISLLTVQLTQLIQQGGNESAILLKKTELRYYMLIQEGLNGGYPVWQSLQLAFDQIGGTDGEKGSPGNVPQELQAIYDSSVQKLTV